MAISEVGNDADVNPGVEELKVGDLEAFEVMGKEVKEKVCLFFFTAEGIVAKVQTGKRADEHLLFGKKVNLVFIIVSELKVVSISVISSEITKTYHV